MKNLFITLLFACSFSVTFSQVSTVNEGFEVWPLSDWDVYINGAGTGWKADWQGVAHTGTHSAHSYINNSQVDNWLVSPAVNITNSDYELKFWENHSDTQYYDLTSVLISTTTGDPSTGNYTQIFTSPNTPTSWTQRTIDLSAYVGQTVHVAFRYQGTWHIWFVDDVTIQPTNFTDAKFTQVVNPTGVSLNQGPENIIFRLENNGTDTIDTISIDWKINSVLQATFTNNGLNLMPNADTNLNVGSYNFASYGNFNIDAVVTAPGDIDAMNDSIHGVYSITTTKDAELISVTPEGMSPFTGVQNVKVTLENVMMNTIDTLEVQWSVDGVFQSPFQTNSLNLTAGSTTEVVIGAYNFPKGVFELEVFLHALGDNNPMNDSYLSYAAIDTIWASFEGKNFPPENWSMDYGVREDLNWDLGPLPHGDYFYSSMPDTNYFGIVSDTIFTPLLDIANGDELKFNLKMSAFLAASHSIIWKEGTTGIVHFIQNVTTTPDVWQQVIVDITSATGTNYIGITSSVSSFSGHSKFDLISSSAKTHHNSLDLKAIDAQFYFLAKENSGTNFDCRIKNVGTSSVLGSAYTVRLMQDPGVVLASVNGVNMAPWSDTTLTINYSFTSIDKHKLYFEIDYSADEDVTNNFSRTSKVSVVPASTVISAVGQPDYQSSSFPFNSMGSANSLGQDDLSQTIYRNSDINVSGNMYGIIYTYDNLLGTNEVKHLPLKIWISQTANQSLNSGWIGNSNLTLVYDDTVEIFSGMGKEMYIPFDTAVLYSGIDNVVIQAYQYDPEWPPSILRIYGKLMPASGPINTIGLYDYYALDPNALPSTYNYTRDFAYTQFVVEPIVNYCSISGTVFDNGGVTLAGAEVSVNGTSINVFSNANGEYTLPDLPYGTYDISASFLGYNDSIETMVLNTATQVQDFHLLERTKVSITGWVAGDNAPSIPLENVQIEALGYTSDNATSNSSGSFLLSNIYGVSNYKVRFSMYGYFDTILTVLVTDTNINLGTILLKQEFISPYDVFMATYGSSTIKWEDPLQSKKGKLQNDLNMVSHSYTNEPLEDVWLGNIFEIADTTTITSVEFLSDIYINATDYVQIEVFNSSEELIASSDSFLMMPDSFQTIDIPNIVVYDDIYVMIHWKDNVASTNALTIDFSDSNIYNGAVIKYPSQPIMLLTDFFANGAPNMSFILRANTLEYDTPITNEEDLSFNVYRGLASEFPSLDNWQLLNATPVSGTSYSQDPWTVPDPSAFYRYAVETVYTNGVSEVTFSNSVLGSILGVKQVDEAVFNIQLYPNPATNVVHISLNEPLEKESRVIIRNALGQIVSQFNVSPGTKRFERNVSMLPNGAYFMSVEINTIRQDLSFVIQR